MEVGQGFYHHFSLATTLPLAVVVVTLAVVRWATKVFDTKVGCDDDVSKGPLPPPGPTPLPMLGSLHLLNGHSPPYAGFTDLVKTYGNIFSIRLGSVDCVVVNDVASAREILGEKGSQFDARPDFRRFDSLFGGSKQNSLAFCDYNQLQCKRRNMMKRFTFPHAFSFNWNRLDQICQEETSEMVWFIQDKLSRSTSKSWNVSSRSQVCDPEVLVDMKTLITKVCANIFNKYFCGLERMEFDDLELAEFCQAFDLIFWEVNNGRAVDFMPWLMPFMWKSTRNMADLSHKVRDFVEQRIIASKLEFCKSNGDDLYGSGDASEDFLDTIMKYIEEEPEQERGAASQRGGGLDRDTALFALEDIIGGHSAVASITLRTLKDLALEQEMLSSFTMEQNETFVSPSAQQRIRRQILDTSVAFSDLHTHSGPPFGDGKELAGVGLTEKKNQHWLMASIYETIRLTCSPIVPHRANQDATIGGFEVKQGTAVFINNHALNMTDELWHLPEKYNPSRFLDDKGQFTKPNHFFPFSMGRRSCMGYKMVQNVSYSVLSALIKHFQFTRVPSKCDSTPGVVHGHYGGAARSLFVPEVEEQMPVGMLATVPSPIFFRVERYESMASAEEGRFRA